MLNLNFLNFAFKQFGHLFGYGLFRLHNMGVILRGKFNLQSYSVHFNKITIWLDLQ